MLEVFNNKVKNNEYISKYLYLSVKNFLTKDFDLDSYNQKVLDSEYEKYKDYFDNMYKDVDASIKLDKEQAQAIIADENHELIIAGAGSGKTTTMVSKVKYLVDIKHVDPSKILVMSYTKKATEELAKRIVIDFNIPVDVCTFHSLGYKIIRNYYKGKLPYIVDENKRNKVFIDWFKTIFEDKNKMCELIKAFNIGDDEKEWFISKKVVETYKDYKTFDEFYDNYKEIRYNELLNTDRLSIVINKMINRAINAEQPLSIKGELMKSKGEAIIANTLIKNNIDFEYEKVYNAILPDYKTYRPDFTLDYYGQKVYLEYFGLSTYNGSQLPRYNKIRRMKEEYHKQNNNKFIKVDYTPGEKIENTVIRELKKEGFSLIPKSDKEIFNILLDTFKSAEFLKLKDFIYLIIDTLKSSIDRKKFDEIVKKYLNTLNDNEKKQCSLQYKFIYEFYLYYQKCMFNSIPYGFDYSDLIYYSKEAIANVDPNIINYDYVIIDEYQDISFSRYELAYKLINLNNCKITAVGDDWQTIYSFAGSNIEYIYEFEKYFPFAKKFLITKTYRNPKILVDVSSKFVMKNEDQIKKDLVSSRYVDKPFVFVRYTPGNEIESLKSIIEQIHKEKPEHNILILARTNRIINNLFYDDFFINDLGTKVKIKNIDDIEVDAMSMHKSKGLTADEVIVMHLNANFPIDNMKDFWFVELFKNKIKEEKKKYAEERRLFYVALTRTKNRVYLLTPENNAERSVFVDELYDIMKEVKESKLNS